MRLGFMQLLTLDYALFFLHQTQGTMNALQDVDPPADCT